MNPNKIDLAQVQSVTVLALVVFALIMVLIGVHSARRTKTMDGFLLGGREIGPWMSAFAYGTTYFSAVIFIGYAGQHGWNIGLGSMWIGIGNAVLGCLLAWLVLAGRSRSLTRHLKTKTMPEFFEARYQSRNMKFYCAVIIFVFLVPYSAAVYKGLGSMFNVIFPSVDAWVIMLVIAVLSAIYLVLGGYVAIARNDFVQGIIMIAGVVLMVFTLVNHPNVGGVSAAVSKLKTLGAAENLALTSWYGGKSWSFLATNILLTSFGTWGLPQMVTKFYAIKDKRSVLPATVISTAFALIIGLGAYFTGSLGRIFLGNTLPAGGVDYVVPNTLMAALGDSNLFTTLMLAVILLLLLSASMSTLSAIVLTSASAITVDLLPGFFPSLEEKRQMRITRWLCLLFVAFSFLFAIMKISVIVNIMSFSWGVVSGCFIGPYIWGLYWKKTTRAGAWSGLIGGLATVGALTLYMTVSRGGFGEALKFAPVAGVIAMGLSMVIVPLVSLFTPKYPRETIARIFKF